MRAGVIEISLDASTLSGASGSVLPFFGTLTNAAGDVVYLNADNFNLAVREAPPPLRQVAHAGFAWRPREWR